jgi:NHLM bacteriocin system ABC transporter ATP-binding protein
MKPAEGPGESKEIRVVEGVATIGREKTCTVVLADPGVSRQHARVELVQDTVKLTDPGSANGVWIGTKRVKEAVLTPGVSFRVGSTMFECLVEAPPTVQDEVLEKTVFQVQSPLRQAAPPPTAASAAGGFLLRLVPEENGQTGREIMVPGDSAVIGRDREATVVIPEKEISRRHTRVDRVGNAFEVVDLGSANGTWVNGKAITAKVTLGHGESFKLGSHLRVELVIPGMAARAAEAAHPPAAKAPAPAAPGAPAAPAAARAPAAPAAAPEPSDFSQTLVVPMSAAMLGLARKVEDEGELLELGGHKQFLLDDPDSVWYVMTGGIDIFTVAVKDGRPEGARTHFLGILPGQCFFGFDLLSYGMGSGFLGVPKQGTKLRKIKVSRFQELGASKSSGASIAALLESWVKGLAKCLTRDIKPPATLVALKPGESVTLNKQAKAHAAEGVVWTEMFSGSLLFDDMTTPVFSEKHVLFPLTADAWVQPVSDEFGDLTIKPRRTVDVVGDPALWQGLQIFHQVLCECEFINKKLAAVDEFIRLEEKERYSEAAREQAYDAIGSVLRPEGASPKEFLQTGSAEPVVRACRLVGQSVGMEVKAHPDANDNMTYEEKVASTASVSGFRTRVVALRGQWWTEDNGAILGLFEQTKTPVALLPTGPRSYEYVDGKTGESGRVTAEVARRLSGFAYTFYAPFPDGPVSVKALMKFGAHGVMKDARMLLTMGITIGVLGTLAPYVTGQIFDSAIPQADRGLLFAFGLALFGAAIATAAFKLTQGIATQRIQGKMEHAIQSALWDRLLNAPANFFRIYPAGDLAERAAGVDAIQGLISGAAVSAILGMFSAFFYVFSMFSFSLKMALTAIALTLFFVTVTTFCNYLQLRHQRNEMQFRGRISGLVLNLITGVSKLRICGAEYHAFKVWATQFAQQRKVSFSIGQIKNTAAVFSGIFPIISSMGIFLMMLQEQAAAAEAHLEPPSTGEFIAFNTAFGLFLAAIQSLADASLNMLRVMPIYERLQPILLTPSEADGSKAYPGKIKGAIELSRVRFRYNDESPWIVNDMSLKIEPGDFVAFVGGSGCGKSTVMRLLLGFEKPATGSIYYDGQDLSQLDLRLLRQQLGVVLQVSRVLPTDIYRNIVGVSSRTIDEAWAAAESAGLAEDVRRMPMGMHTYVSEGGGTLSGGQRQRLLIARALANKPKVIFLDEATSALDNRTQAIVTESMDRLDATRIVIAHRLSTIINANKICYLDAGKVMEIGSYKELMDKDGMFAALAKRQMA